MVGSQDDASTAEDGGNPLSIILSWLEVHSWVANAQLRIGSLPKATFTENSRSGQEIWWR